MSEFIWALIAKLASSRIGFLWILRRASHQVSKGVRMPDIASGGDIYMRRYWVFNPYPESNKKFWWGRWLPSVRLHHILLPDSDRHLHDHPWNFRTIVLDGWYREECLLEFSNIHPPARINCARMRGDTLARKVGEFHRIASVSAFGVWTLFFTWKYQEQWGFLVGGKKVYSRDYLKQFNGSTAPPSDTLRK